MNRFVLRLLVMCALVACIFACAAFAAEIRLPGGGPSGRVKSITQNVAAAKLAGITHDSLGQLTAMGSANGQTFGAGAGKVGMIGENGLVASSAFNVPITRASGLSAYTAGKLVVGDEANNSVFAVDLNSKQSTKLFTLGELNARGIQAASVLQNGKLGGLAFDGKFLYAGVKAGYSSSIFKIDPSTKQVVGHAYAPGPDPSAMQFVKGNLFVLEGSRQNVRRFDGNLKLANARTEVDSPDGRGLIVTDQGISILSPSKRTIERLKVDTTKLIQSSTITQMLDPVVVAVAAGVISAPQKYAVLICGDVAESGFDEFWGDTVWMYKMLRAKGYTKENIYVLYGYGADYASPNPFYQVPGETVTDFSATTTNVNLVLDGLKNGNAARGIKKMKDNDSLFIWMFDHGGGGPTNSYLCLMNGTMSDTAFAAKANAIPYAKRAIFMQQCRSGGFIDNLQNSKSFVSSACRGSENAHQADTEKEQYNGKWYHHGEYNYYVISAFSGKTPTGANVNADANSSGKVSALEAHQWMVSKENQSEVPQVSGNSVGSGFYLN